MDLVRASSHHYAPIPFSALKIGSLETEKSAIARQLEALTSNLTSQQQNHDGDVARAIAAEESLAQARSDISRQAVQIVNLQQALENANHRQSGQPNKNTARVYAENALDVEQLHRDLKTKIQISEARLREKEEEVVHWQRLASTAGRSSDESSSKRVDRMMALENENIAFKAENLRLQSSCTINKSSPSIGSPKSRYPASTPSGGGRTCRPRSSSLSGPPDHPDGAAARLCAQNVDLLAINAELQAELTKTQARAAKAEREGIRASNEAIVAIKQGQAIEADLRDRLREVSTELDWKREECQEIAGELVQCQAKLEKMQSELQDVQSHTKLTDVGQDDRLYLVQLEAAQAKQDLEDLKVEFSQTQKETRAKESRLRLVTNQLEEAHTALVEAQQRLSSSSQISDEDTAHVAGSKESTHRACSNSPDFDNDTISPSVEAYEHQIQRLKEEVVEKTAFLEQAEALAEEGSRHLLIKSTEIKQLSEEITLLRQRGRESDLEIEVLRGSAAPDGDIEGRLAQFREQLSLRDEQLMCLRKELKSRSGELEAGKRQLKRLASHLSNQQTLSFPIDLSSTATTPSKASRKMTMAHTPISRLLKANHFFTTPGGRPLGRPFEEDLLDQVELLRDALEHLEQQRDFVRVESSMQLKRLSIEIAAKTETIQALQGELAAVKSKLHALSGHCSEGGNIPVHDKAVEEDANKEVGRLKDQLIATKETLESTQNRLEASEALFSSKENDRLAEIDRLHRESTAVKAWAGSIVAISERLTMKQNQLLAVETQGSHLRIVETRLRSAEQDIVANVKELQKEERERSVWLSACDSAAKSFEDFRERKFISATVMKECEFQSNTSKVSEMRLQLEELQAKVIRREEQIGSQQLQLQSARTKLAMAEDDYEELLEERDDLAGEFAQLQSKLDRAVQQHTEAQDAARLEIQELNEALRDTTRRLDLTLQKVADLQENQSQLSTEDNSNRVDDEELIDLGAALELSEAMIITDHLRTELQTVYLQRSQVQAQADAQAVELARVRASHAELITECGQLGARLSDSVKGPSSSRSSVAWLQRENERLAEEITDIKADHAQAMLEAQQEKAAAQMQQEKALSELGVLRKENAEICAELQTSQMKLEAALNDVEIANTCLADTQAELEVAWQDEDKERAADAIVTDAAEQARQLREEIDDLRSEMKQRSEDHQDALQAVKRELEESRSVINKAEIMQKDQRSTILELRDSAAKDAGLVQTLEIALDAVRTKLQERDTAIDALRKVADSVCEEKANFTKQLNAMKASLDRSDSALQEKQKALEDAEREITSRGVALRERSEEFWTLKEELAELQEEQERSRLVAQSIQDLKSQLSNAEQEITLFAKVRERLEKAESDLNTIREEHHKLEQENARKASELADLQGELKRRKAATRFNEEELQALRAAKTETETALRETQTESLRLESQLKAVQAGEAHLRKDIDRLKGEIEAAIAKSVHTVSENGLNPMEGTKLKDEVAYLNSRISELERELEVKADEVESADGRILESLKENKKLASKVKSLHKQLLLALQKDATPPLEKQATLLQADIRQPEVPSRADQPMSVPFVEQGAAKGASEIENEQSSSLETTVKGEPPPTVGRKRPSPEEEMPSESHMTGRARGVYVPPSSIKTSSVGFMPVRRTVARSPHRNVGLQDLTNIDRAVANVDTMAGQRETVSDEKKPAPTLKPAEAAPAKRTFNGTRPPGSANNSDLLSALHAKRKLASAAHRA